VLAARSNRLDDLRPLVPRLLDLPHSSPDAGLQWNRRPAL